MSIPLNCWNNFSRDRRMTIARPTSAGLESLVCQDCASRRGWESKVPSERSGTPAAALRVAGNTRPVGVSPRTRTLCIDRRCRSSNWRHDFEECWHDDVLLCDCTDQCAVCETLETDDYTEEQRGS